MHSAVTSKWAKRVVASATLALLGIAAIAVVPLSGQATKSNPFQPSNPFADILARLDQIAGKVDQKKKAEVTLIAGPVYSIGKSVVCLVANVGTTDITNMTVTIIGSDGTVRQIRSGVTVLPGHQTFHLFNPGDGISRCEWTFHGPSDVRTIMQLEGPDGAQIALEGH